MSGPGDDDDDDDKAGKGKPAGAWPPDAEYAEPTGAPDVYDPGYVPPPANPAADNAHAAEGPPAELYPTAGTPSIATQNPSPPQANLAPQTLAAPPGAVTPPSTAAGDLPAESGDATASDWLAHQGDYAAGGEWTPSPSDAPPPGDWQMPPPGPVLAEEPLLPPELAADGALNDAIGAPSAKARRRARTQPRRDDGDDDDGLAPPRNRRTMIIATASIVVGLGIATLVFLGRANAQRYVLSCNSAHAVAEQGRGFPPWGSRPMHGSEWAPIALPANAECQPRETDDINELGKWYLELLLDRANVTLTARDLLDSVGSQSSANPLDLVGAQLDQALLLARDPDRRDQRRDITRLQGDVAYWRAAARLRDASTVLVEAAKQFDAANQQHPRHATDAAAWSTFLHHLVDELHAGPNGAAPIAPSTATNAAATGTTPVPVGSALPVEPDTGAAGSAVSPPTPDAGIPSGGVLL
ncbi:MAG: hypothetical protein ABJE66_31000 [Deltaproteobacteria bacterium]